MLKTSTTFPPTDKDNEYRDINTQNKKNNKYYRPKKIKIGYKSLTTKEQRDFYIELRKSIGEVAEETTEDNLYPCKMVSHSGVVLTQAEIRLVISAVKMDNPTVFWLADHFGYSNTNDYTAIQLYSYASPEKIKKMNDELFKSANKILASLEDGLDEYSLELKIHNKIIDMCKYADNVKSSKDDYLAFTAYGVLVNGSAVCEGYSKTFQYLLSQLGIESATIMGKGSSELHMWNAVKINGNWYYVDVGWDDSKEYSKYDYFNITTEEIKADHTISKLYADCTSDEVTGKNGETAINFNHFIPKCNSVEENYYVKSTPHFTDLYSYENYEMTNALYETANNRDSYFSFYIDPLYLDYSGAVENLFHSGDQLFFTYIDTVNSMYPENFIDKGHIYIVKKKNLSVVTVKLKYE